MSVSIFESFGHYLEQSDYPKGKKKIMEAAVEQFSRYSYHGTSTLQIAKAAGLSQATLFKYFKTKEDLLVAIIHPVAPGLFVDFFDHLLTYQTPEDMVHFLVRDRMAFFGENQALFKIILQELLAGDKVKAEQKRLWETISPKVLAVKKRLEGDARVNPQLTVTQVVRIFIGPILAYFGQLYLIGQGGDFSESDLQLIEKQILAGLWQ
ncbi:TetR/AcrR family transcriptional regulator [Streptococcus sp. DD12]|uniref:TetR/AcrR family transcriptional regulator n=1 Tax=Streptococcus sp. DD12 TaxID=1777880 RepID=UPI0007990D6B|nr:TetR/AcrR family transcriptional regulator [Streptococcus sp. DD12]KXT76855.1 Transcriptional regulator, TetR family [Streptococcus sp. DD12]